LFWGNVGINLFVMAVSELWAEMAARRMHAGQEEKLSRNRDAEAVATA